MSRSRTMGGCELWPVPGFAAMGALETAAGPAPVALAGPRDATDVVVLAGESLEVVRGLCLHAARKGLGAVALRGLAGTDGATLVRAAVELCHLRGAARVALVAQGAWVDAALRVAPGAAEAVAAIDPARVDPSIDPQRLAGIPLWIASGTETSAEAQALHDRSRHPRALIELPNVSRLEHAVSDVAALLVPFLRHTLQR